MLKRVFSILLIAAALFGAYNDVVNLKDVLACKDYWQTESDKAEADLNKLGAGITKLEKGKKAYLKGSTSVKKTKATLARNEAKYKAAPGRLAAAKKKYQSGKTTYSKVDKLIKSITSVRTSYVKTWKPTFDKLNSARKAIVTGLSGPATDGGTVKAMLIDFADNPGHFKTPGSMEAYKKAINDLNNTDQTAAGYKTFGNNCLTVATNIDSMKAEEEQLLKDWAVLGKYNYEPDGELQQALNKSAQLFDSAVRLLRRDILYSDIAWETAEEAKKGDITALTAIHDCASIPEFRDEIKENIKNYKFLQYYSTDKMKTFAEQAYKNADSLTKGQDKIAKGISKISKTILGDKELKKSAKKAMGKDAIKLLKKYKKTPNRLNSSQSSLLVFENQMDKDPGWNTILEKANKKLTTERTSIKKKLTTGLSAYKKNLTAYKKSKTQIKTAKTKLKAAEKKLTDYEAGEKQAKKGLANLTSSKPNGELESISDRIGGDDNFVDKKGRVDTKKGMSAVHAGEDYLNEQGELITSEITGRIIGTILGFLSVALALLAAVLSFLLSNRGAAVIASISAVAAAGSAVVGSSAGTLFSELAGSTIGNKPWIAAAAIAGVAMAFAAMHFAAKVEEEI